MSSTIPQKHDLAEYVEEVSLSIQKDYDTIRKRVKEDPGTAGDQVEETWAEVLRNWLPNHYHVVTKGRILGVDGVASPQIDVLILWPSYPPFLLKKKMYLASGVAAAFECKLTLRISHFRKAFETAVKLSEITKTEYDRRKMSAKASKDNFSYEEYHRIFEYGILSHSFESETSAETAEKIDTAIKDLDKEIVRHPSQMLDLGCIQTIGSWVSERYAISDYLVENKDGFESRFLAHPRTGYHALTKFSWSPDSSTYNNFSPLGSFIARLYTKLSRVDETLAPLANFFVRALSTGAAGGSGRVWQELATPPEILNAIMSIPKGPQHRSLLHKGFFFLGF